jgi:shikimate kinase
MAKSVQLPIILIGPMATGKSSVATELAKLTGVPNVPMDMVRWYYYFKDGYSREQANTYESFSDLMTYWKPFELKAIERILNEFPESIIDFGAGHSYFTDLTQFATVSELLKPLPNIFLLLPCESKTESLQICNTRLKERVNRELKSTEIEANRDFINHDSNYLLCKHIVYTKNVTPLETAMQVFELLNSKLLAV